MMTSAWITTREANEILDGGISDQTFRIKFRDHIPWKLTPGGKLRWLRSAVQELATVMPEVG
jgi:hypothetical protein